jgi:hypothetical protein
MTSILAPEDHVFVFHSPRNTDDDDWPGPKIMETGLLLTGPCAVY